MIYGYIRVSSDKQTVENQRFEINKFCDKKSLMIDDWIEEPLAEQKTTISANWGDCLKRLIKTTLLSVASCHGLDVICL